MYDFHITNGFVRWNSNNQIPFDDMLQQFVDKGLITQMEMIESSEQRTIETANFIEDYRERMKTYVPSDEEMFEMRSAFGEVTVVVNAITGKRTQL